MPILARTGPGSPGAQVDKIVRRFYSQRPDGESGTNSELRRAISSQIVEAHGGVIRPKTIRPTRTEPTSEALDARRVVGLPP